MAVRGVFFPLISLVRWLSGSAHSYKSAIGHWMLFEISFVCLYTSLNSATTCIIIWMVMIAAFFDHQA